MEERTPPHDEHAEQAMISIALNLGRIPEAAEHLQPKDFYLPKHETIWRSMLTLRSLGLQSDIITVRSRLQERHELNTIGAAYLVELLNTVPAVDRVYVAGVIADRSMRRELIAAHTRGLQNAYDSDNQAEAQLERSEAELTKIGKHENQDADSLLTLAEFMEDEEAAGADWVMEGYLRRGERLIITGVEGLGKTTWLRQMAVCSAAGLDPFTGRGTQPMTVLVIDAENPRHIMRKRYRELVSAVHAHGSAIEPTRFWLDNRPEGLDLADPTDRRWLAKRVKLVNPDLLVIGPAYKLHVSTNEDKDETLARTVIAVLDDVRTSGDCALILEHHAGNESGGGVRPVRPYGSSLWRRWPDFGYGIRPTKHPEAERRRLVDVIAWKGPRDVRAWPKQMESGGDGLPWVEAVA
jgi:replicative DNA helicase